MVRSDRSSIAGRGWLVVLLALTLGLPAVGNTADAVGSFRDRLQELRKQRKAVRQSGPAQRAGDATAATEAEKPYVDELLREEWQALGFPVSERCSDGEFLRRATLDLIGRIPTLAETEEFLRDKSGDKRARLVDRLLASPDYGRHWATYWSKLLLPDDAQTGGANQNANPEALFAWLEREFNRNTPWNAMVREMVGGTGRWDENGAVNFMIANNNVGGTTQTAAYITRVFLCVQTQCTECHDHPWNEWRQDQFHGLKAFLDGTRAERTTRISNAGVVSTDYYELAEGPLAELQRPGAFFERRNGMTVFVPPTYLDGRSVRELVSGDSTTGEGAEVLISGSVEESDAAGNLRLRQILAETITADDNPYFARAMVNRMWHQLFGHSFTKDVDDFENGLDEPSMPELLDRLADDFVASGYDVKALARWICNSKAYSLSSKQRGKVAEDSVGFFTSMLLKPLTAEQLYDSVITVTGIHQTSKSANTAAERRQFIQRFKETFGNTALPTSAPTYEGTVTQSLMMMNSPLVHQACQCAPGTMLHKLVGDESLTDAQRVDKLYLAALCRLPTGAERQAVGRLLQAADSPPQGLQDVLWALLNSAEFQFNR